MSLRRLLMAFMALALLVPASASADRLTVRGTQVFKSVLRDTPTQFGNEFVAFNGFLYFVADNDASGSELWRTDGTNAGTSQVADLYAGITSSNPHRLTVVGTRLYFNATPGSGQSSETVHYLDASAPTTVQLAKAIPVGGGAPITAIGALFGAVNGRALIGRLAEGNGYYAVYSVAPGSDTFNKISAGAESVDVTNVFSPAATAGGWTYYSRSNVNVSPGQGAELWRTNGSITESVKDIAPGNTGSSPSAFYATSDRVYFTANDGTRGTELWVTNPADKADTHVVYEHVPGTGPSSIDDPNQGAVGNVLYYVPSNDPVTGSELWRTDGTTAGTRVVKDITPGAGGVSAIRPFAVGGGAGVGFLRGSDIFASLDGTDAATIQVGSVDGDGYGPNTPVALGNRTYFVGGASPFGQALWRTDGTVAGTHPISAAGFDGTSATGGNPAAQTLAVLGDKLIFFARDPETNDSGRLKLFVLDTTQPDEQRASTVSPVISGTPTVGNRLDVSKGEWSGRATVFSYQWLRNGQPIPAATNTYYFASAADVGQTISARVTTLGIGAPREASADAAGVAIGGTPQAGGNTPTPPARSGGVTPPPVQLPSLVVKKKGKLTGTARVGKTLKLDLPTFDQKSGVKLSFVWSAGGKTIAKQTKSSLKLAGAQKGKKISVTITATKSGFVTAKVTLGPTAKVKAKKS